MNSTWIITNDEQLTYLKAMAVQHFTGYQAHAFSERQHFWAKATTINHYLVPTLLEYLHLKLIKPTSTLELMAYRREKRQLIKDILQNTTDNIRHINAVIRKLDNVDDWEQLAGVALIEEGHVEAGLDLANLFGLGQLMA
ncbi:hypothetical protein BCR42DRAFT_440449 [Absidia repens]|uniref:Uncharacterized protein n=1 Tax=Absidia repens TaxID=90262 RepID=A0A1X2I823_9FUNG|nr:hypothetical protein BCR42DRAFT_440449 [Absidia repens]